MSNEFMNPDMLHSEISSFKGFDKVVYTFARMLQITGSATLKYQPRGVVLQNKEDIVVSYLAKNNSRSYEKGRGTQQTAKDLNLAKSTISKTYSDLVKKGLVLTEQRGVKIRYYLPPLPSGTQPTK